MTRHTTLAIFFAFILLSLPLQLPVTASHGTHAGDPQSSGQEVVPQGQYRAIPIVSDNVSILAYGFDSNQTVSVYLMTQEEYLQFSGGAETYPILGQTGLENVSELLLTPGTYNLVIFAKQAPVNTTYYLDIMSNFTIANSTTYVGEFLTVPAKDYFSALLHLETTGSPSNLLLLGATNQTVTYSVYDESTQSFVFTSPPETVTNFSLAAALEGQLQYNISLEQGQYYLVINNTNPTATYVYFEYHIIPEYVDPYLQYGSSSTFAPIGMASYGIGDYPDSPNPYNVLFPSAAGYVNISSLHAYDSNYQSYGMPNPYWASLQLNLVLLAQNVNNSTYTYWAQNVLQFDTNADMLHYNVNVWNFTGDTASLTNETIQGSGSVYPSKSTDFYGDRTSGFGYKLPLSLLLYINETTQQGAGIWVYMGARLLRNGSSVPNAGKVWFDKIFIVDSNVKDASFVVTGKMYTPAGVQTFLGHMYDAELVWGGGFNGEQTSFTSLAAQMGLYYENGSIGYRQFPTYYSFGGDTAEAVDNLHVSYEGMLASVNTGQLSNQYLGASELGSTIPVVTTTPPSPPPKNNYYGLEAGAGILAAAIVVVAIVVLPRWGSGKQQTLTEQTLTHTRFCTNCGTRLAKSTAFCTECGTAQPSLESGNE